MRDDIHEAGSSATAAATRRRPEDKSGPSGQDKQEMMKKMEEAGKPGAGHKALEPLIGNWKAEVKCWHEPGGQAQVSQGTSKVSWVLNGHFVEEQFRGEMMGKPFNGRGLLGYDNTKQTFNSVWVSDMQTSMFCTEGKGESGNKVITLQGKTTCAATGEKDVPMKMVFRLQSPEKFQLEMFDGRHGKDEKVMEITYTKQ